MKRKRKLLAAACLLCMAGVLAGQPSSVHAVNCGNGVVVSSPQESFAKRQLQYSQTIDKVITNKPMQAANNCAKTYDVVREKLTAWIVGGKNVFNLDLNTLREAAFEYANEYLENQINTYCNYVFDTATSTLNIAEDFMNTPGKALENQAKSLMSNLNTATSPNNTLKVFSDGMNKLSNAQSELSSSMNASDLIKF